MDNEEAKVYIKAIEKGLYETGKDSPYRDALIPKMKEACGVAFEALEKESVIDDIKAEINKELDCYKEDARYYIYISGKCSGLDKALEIIDKYIKKGKRGN